ncbi:MAG: chlorophyll synthesis pathway protein BchC [Gemmatimonadales bacterium]|nr:chlorophyll synthesis pathway protein BchC [Gemmatimonadales bacterium]
MHTSAVVFEEPRRLTVRRLELIEPGPADVIVEVQWTGISTGTERLLLSGEMPPFPGLGYPLVPGYEAVGRVVLAGPQSGRMVGQLVFVPGARCFPEVRCLFGAAARRLVVPGSRAFPLAEDIGSHGALLALAATAYHAGWQPGVTAPDLIIGHGALGRLLARIAKSLGDGPAPTVWEINPARREGADGYRVIAPDEDGRTDYRAIYDVSGDGRLLDQLIGRLAPGGEVVLAGFYHQPLSFAFVPAFLREARIRVAAEWKPDDLQATVALANAGRLRLDGIISHQAVVHEAPAAYEAAFHDPTCVKMVLDWREAA